jgi:hypothetical protein
MQEPLFLQEHSPFSQPESSPVHRVEFYDPRCFPARRIADYFCSGLEAEESSFIIATPDHTHLVKDCLQVSGLDSDALERAGLLTCLDAPSTLAALRGNGPLNDHGIDSALGIPLAGATKLSRNGRVRVYGELVNLAANDGDYLTCVQIERHCNRLLAAHSFRFYHAYSIENFANESSAGTICEVCDLHDEIVPAISGLRPKGWLALLLERSRALQAEIQTRKAVESALRGWEADVARLLDALVAQWSDDIGQGLPKATGLAVPQLADYYENLDWTVERSLREILLACVEACAAMRCAPEGSAEWYKRTGEILAHGKLTHVIYNLQHFVRTQERH